MLGQCGGVEGQSSRISKVFQDDSCNAPRDKKKNQEVDVTMVCWNDQETRKQTFHRLLE